MIGNSRLHWAWFTGATLEEAWDTEHLPASVVESLLLHCKEGELPREILSPRLIARWKNYHPSPQHLPIYLASVVPTQTALWQSSPVVTEITLEHIPLQGTYPTLGVDRALALWGAGVTLGWPILVIDAGTALTFTGADSDQQLVGGAILPGLKLQLESLSQRTAALPSVELPIQMPRRWALTTLESIQSGVVYTVLAGVRDFITSWKQQFPTSTIVLTGGDRSLVQTYLQAEFPSLAAEVIGDPYLIFWGLRFLVQSI